MASRDVPLGVTRIGVHAGPAIVGNFGGGRLFDYTAYGDTINAAARLEAVNKQLGTRICVSAAAAKRAGDFSGRPVGDLVLRGRSEPLRAFEPLSPEDAASPEAAAYMDAFAKLEARDPFAVAAFAALIGARPSDALAQYHLKRLLNGVRARGSKWHRGGRPTEETRPPERYAICPRRRVRLPHWPEGISWPRL